MICRFLYVALGTYFFRVAVVFLTYGMVTGNWFAIVLGVMEAAGAGVLIMLGTN